MTGLVDLGKFSEPATRLVERVSDAVEGLCRPWQIERVAAAEAEAERLKALAQVKTEIEVTDLRRRALERFVHEEARKQGNMEEIIRRTLPQIGDTARPEDIDRDWIVHFFDRCRLISDEETQQLWARVLAGEAEKPGSFSKRTIDLMGTLSKHDAETFSTLCRFVWIINGHPCPVIWKLSDGIYHNAGFRVGHQQHLAEIGLISVHDFSHFSVESDVTQSVISYFGKKAAMTILEERRKRGIAVGNAKLSLVGRELFPLADAKPVDGFWDYMVRNWTEEPDTYRIETLSDDTDSAAVSNKTDPYASTLPPRQPPARWS